MTPSDRRTFIKQSATAVAALAVARCAPERAAAGLDDAALKGVAEAVLPSELGADGFSRVVRDFRAWLAEFEPGAELDHGYISSEITYAPPHPGPVWGDQLAALERAAQAEHGTTFGALGVASRQSLLRRHMAEPGGAILPPAIQADHVAVAVMAFFYGSPEAADLCYRAGIGDRTCRPLAAAVEAPRRDPGT